MYSESVKNPDKYWEAQANLFLDWIKSFDAVSECMKAEGIVKWFTGGLLNVTSKLIRSSDGFCLVFMPSLVYIKVQHNYIICMLILKNTSINFITTQTHNYCM